MHERIRRVADDSLHVTDRYIILANGYTTESTKESASGEAPIKKSPTVPMTRATIKILPRHVIVLGYSEIKPKDKDQMKEGTTLATNHYR